MRKSAWLTVFGQSPQVSLKCARVNGASAGSRVSRGETRIEAFSRLVTGLNPFGNRVQTTRCDCVIVSSYANAAQYLLRQVSSSGMKSMKRGSLDPANCFSTCTPTEKLKNRMSISTLRVAWPNSRVLVPDFS